MCQVPAGKTQVDKYTGKAGRTGKVQGGSEKIWDEFSSVDDVSNGQGM
jgi:hypothetical protein